VSCPQTLIRGKTIWDFWAHAHQPACVLQRLYMQHDCMGRGLLCCTRLTGLVQMGGFSKEAPEGPLLRQSLLLRRWLRGIKLLQLDRKAQAFLDLACCTPMGDACSNADHVAHEGALHSSSPEAQSWQSRCGVRVENYSNPSIVTIEGALSAICET
jgi:hypothetical protein